MSNYKVLIPLDGSRLAEHSLAYVRALRQVGNLEVRLLSVADELEPFEGVVGEEAEDREFNVLSTYLREVSTDIEKHLGVCVDYEIVQGRPAQAILDAAAVYSPDLLVVATHGRSGVSRWRLGSVADKLIRAAESNVLVIGPKAVERETWLDADLIPPFRSILVPLDGSELAESALPVARLFAERYNSALHLVEVVTIPAYGMDAGVGYTPDLLSQLVDGAKSYIHATTAKQRTPSVPRGQVIVGAPATELEQYVDENGIDLVVMTSHGRGGIVRTALGSVTDRLLGTKAPVLIVRSN